MNNAQVTQHGGQAVKIFSSGWLRQNVEILNEVKAKRIVTTCPHCLHTLKNEYPAFGGNYTVIHHTQLINELVAAGKLKVSAGSDRLTVTFHDPCYLGRQNNIIARRAMRFIMPGW